MDRRYGLHFDFHAKPFEGMPCIGETLSEADIREICRRVRPEFIQIDCKGHPGYASYPTKLGNAMPGIVGDPLKLWRRVTREEGVKLFMHYSGVMDERFCREHPEYAVMRADGTRSESVTRTYGHAYADMLLIPQLKELAGVYGVDGVWVDGECWATELDFDPETVAAFESDTGLSLEGCKDDPESAPMRSFYDYCRELFREYVDYYVDAVHRDYPNFMICSNWLYSDYMPEPPRAKVDYLSGDFNPWNSVYSSRLAGRALARQGKKWDLMSWNFRMDRSGYSKGVYVKTPEQITQEAASVISLGGGFQNYIPQFKDGSPNMAQIRPMEKVFDFVKERAPWCYGLETVPQIAVFMSARDHYLENKNLFGRDGGERIMGLVSLLCDLGQGVSVASEYDFERGYPLIALPETFDGTGDETAGKLLEYAKNGGSLLLCGNNTIKGFIAAGAPLSCGEKIAERRLFSLGGGEFSSVYGGCAVSAESAEIIARVYENERSEGAPFAGIIPYGKGRIAWIGADIGLSYNDARQAGHTKLMRALLGRLYTPLAQIERAEGTVELNPLRSEGKLLIQMTNMNGAHHDTRTPSFDNLQPCRDIILKLNLTSAPKTVTQRPCGKALPFTFDGNSARVALDRLEYHEIIEIEI